MRSLLLATALGLGLIPQVGAQELRVRVSEPNRPDWVVGVLVTLRSPGGAIVARGITNDLARVRLKAPAGSYQMIVERPGFLDTTYVVTVPAGLDSMVVRHAARRPSFPTSLLAIPPQCMPGITEQTRSLWTEADRALRTVVTTEDEGLLSLSLAGFERRISTDLVVESEQVNTLLGSNNRPGTPRSGADLIARGIALRGDSIEWAAPDQTTFLAEEFDQAHCFGIGNGVDGREGMVGLTFAPKNTGIVGMAGTFWFDPASRELKVIDYSAANVPRDWRVERLGGSIEINRFQPGFWIARFWFQRAPTVQRGKNGGKDKVRSIRELGAEVTAVSVVVDTTDKVATAQAIVQQILAAQARVARMTGTVIDTLGYPVPDAEVSILGADFTQVTDRAGQFTLEGVPLGLQVTRIRKIGYRVQYFPVRLAAGGAWTGKIIVKKLPQVLGEIVVVGKYGKPEKYSNTGKYDGFYRRRAGRNGRFLTRDDIDQRHATRISQLLTGTPGVRIAFDRPNGDEIEIFGCQGQPSIWIDGQRLTGTTQELLRVLSATDVEAMEVYTRETQVPAEFREGTCGAIVMWTR